ncbi:MAG: fibronectin type III domain-containing protein [Acidobacteria bacterium]|nr:fibronectin type III domain-containing protein [Acidobacteriota bacterium]
MRHGGHQLHRPVPAHRAGPCLPECRRLGGPRHRYVACDGPSHGAAGAERIDRHSNLIEPGHIGLGGQRRERRRLQHRAVHRQQHLYAARHGRSIRHWRCGHRPGLGQGVLLPPAGVQRGRQLCVFEHGQRHHACAATSASAGAACRTDKSEGANRQATIKLTWTASSSLNITNIRVYRSTVSGGPYTVIATLPKTTTFTNSGLTIGTTYHYVVSAVNSSGQVSGYSNQASKTAR